MAQFLIDSHRLEVRVKMGFLVFLLVFVASGTFAETERFGLAVEKIDTFRLPKMTCNHRIMDRMNKRKKIVFFEPSLQLVSMESTSPSVTINTKNLQVKRCNCEAHCSDGHCIPTETKTSKKLVQVNDIDKIPQCTAVEIIEHVRCKCECDKKKEGQYCQNLKRDFDRINCRCTCKNADHERAECLKKNVKAGRIDFQWNEKDCLCGCGPDRPMKNCSTNFMWSPEYCDCLGIAMKMSSDGKMMGPVTQDS